MTGQNAREIYTQKFNDKKHPIDSLAEASLGTVGSMIGYTFSEPYYGVFPENDTLRELTMNMGQRAFSKGDTFFLTTVTHPRYNYSVSVHDTTIQYTSPYFKPADHLFEKEAFNAHLKKIKALDIKYILPLWGIIFCGDLDDYGPEEKMEKWWVKTETHDVYVKVERENETFYLSIAMDMSGKKQGKDLTYLGCAEQNTSYIKLNFADGSSFKEMHIEEQNCERIKIDLTEHFDTMQNKLESIELSLSKETKLLNIKSKVQQDVLALKCDCIR